MQLHRIRVVPPSSAAHCRWRTTACHVLTARPTCQQALWRPSRGLHRSPIVSDSLLDPVASAMEAQGHTAGMTTAGWGHLLLTCALMFFGAYGCGLLPRWLSSQQHMTSSVGAVGAGLLLGSALCIILPEGFEAALEGEHHTPSWTVSAALLFGFWLMLMLDSLANWLPGLASSSSSSSRARVRHRTASDAHDINTPAGAAAAGQGSTNPGVLHDANSIAEAAAAAADEHTVLMTDYDGWQRPATTLDTGAPPGQAMDNPSTNAGTHLSGTRRPGSSPTKGRPYARTVALPDSPRTPGAACAGSGAPADGPPLSSTVRRIVSGGSSGGVGEPPQRAAAAGGGAGGSSGSSSSSRQGAGPPRGVAAAGADSGAAPDAQLQHQGGHSNVAGAKSGSSAAAAASVAGDDPGSKWWRPWLVDPTHHALLGLLVHSVSDGLAVGASSLSAVPEISLGVASAMVVHKGPVAMGLATFLRGAGWGPDKVHRGILLFAAASPAAALLAYTLLSIVPGVADNIPLVVLFSGGTVLYAATMHILPTALNSSSSGGRVSHNHSHQQQQSGSASLDRMQLLLVSLGFVLPLVLTAALGDHHHAQHHHVE